MSLGSNFGFRVGPTQASVPQFLTGERHFGGSETHSGLRLFNGLLQSWFPHSCVVKKDTGDCWDRPLKQLLQVCKYYTLAIHLHLETLSQKLLKVPESPEEHLM